MSGLARIGAFAALLAVVFAAAALAGNAVDPEGADDDNGMDTEMTSHETATASDEPRGLAIADDGLRLVADDTALEPGKRERFFFRIETTDGRTVSDFDIEHERALHLIAVRRDLTGYQHLHPRRTHDGAWEVDLRFEQAGTYRVFADFARRGKPYTLGTDVTVGGGFAPQPLPEATDTATADGGYEVHVAEDGHDLEFTVHKDGRELDDIEPYLGARGHLVALREGDLAFLHVHPEDEATAGRGIRFGVTYPSAGRYRLFLQFKHDGKVRTVAFTRTADEAAEESHDRGD